MFNAMIDNPRFVHDCDGCIFLGCHKEYDVYYCSGEMSSKERGGSVILRYGDEGPEYSSGPVSMELYNESLTEASDIRKKVAQWLLREGFVKLAPNPEVVEEKREMWDDFWKKRKA